MIDGRVIQVQRLDEVRIASAKLDITVDLENIAVNGTLAYIELQFRFPDINSDVYTVNIYNTDGSQKSAEFNIGSATIEFPYTASTTNMLVDVIFNTPSTAMHNIAFDATSDIKISLKQSEINVLEAWGYFNRSERVTGDRVYAEIPVDLFGSSIITNNRLLFHNPEILFEVSNNIGVPLSFWVDSIKAVDEFGAVERAWFDNGNPVKDKWTEVPMATPANVGDVASKTITFNRHNGETNRLFLINPERFIYDFHVAVNHQQAKADSLARPHKTHFLSRPLNVNMDVKAYLRFWFDENTIYSSRDTIKLDNNLGELLKIGNLEIEPERVTINIDFKNHLPVQVIANAIFVDENNVELLRRENIKIECPNVYPIGYNDGINLEGMVVSEKVFTLAIALIEEDTEKMLKTRNIIFEYTGTAKNPATDRINVRATDYLNAVVSLFVKGKISGDLGK
jgi:hypothetical protein